MIKVSIRAENWAVSATAHDKQVCNPFNGLNRDAVIASAIDAALMYAGPSICNPFYILARVIVNLDVDRVAAEKFLAAAEEYVTMIEKNHPASHFNPKETQHG